MSNIGVKMIKMLNKVFKKQVHPFNLQLKSEKTYSMWQYEKGEETIKYFLERYSKEEIFKDKIVLDLGCGAGGKSLYYVSLGAKKVVGLDIVKHYQKEAMNLASKLGFNDKFEFVLGDATCTKFKNNSFDVIIMNDFMEHVSDPVKVLLEAKRLICPGGKIYINFPPYYHPFGAHLSDAINIPWCHIFFSEKTLINAYKDLVSNLSDGKIRIDFRISKNKDGEEYFSYVNKITIKKFKNILKKLNIVPLYYKETPLLTILKPFSKFILTKELFVKMVTCVIEGE